MPPPAPQPLAGYQRVTSSDINVLHDAVEPLAIGHDLDALDKAVPLDGVVNGLSLESVSLVWVRYGGAGVIVDTPPTGGEFALCAPSAPMGVEYRRRRHRETATGSLLLSHDERMRMTPDPDRGCLVIATATGRLADHAARLPRPPASQAAALPLRRPGHPVPSGHRTGLAARLCPPRLHGRPRRPPHGRPQHRAVPAHRHPARPPAHRHRRTRRTRRVRPGRARHRREDPRLARGTPRPAGRRRRPGRRHGPQRPPCPGDLSPPLEPDPHAIAARHPARPRPQGPARRQPRRAPRPPSRQSPRPRASPARPGSMPPTGSASARPPPRP